MTRKKVFSFPEMLFHLVKTKDRKNKFEKYKVKPMATSTGMQKQQERKQSQSKRQSRHNPDMGIPKVPLRQQKAKATRELLSDWRDAP
jgi:hypothetical protein